MRVVLSGITSNEFSPVKVYLAPSTGVNISVPAVDTAAAPGVKTVVDTNTALLEVSARTPNPAFPVTVGANGLFREFKYRVVFESPIVAGCKVEATSPSARALFRAPPWTPSKRYGSRTNGSGNGGDDWSSPALYKWLDGKRTGVPNIKYDDILGEHGKNIGHTGHKFGLNIDVFQFGEYNGVTSGCENYNRLRADVVSFVTSPDKKVVDAAKARIIPWVTAQRAGIVALQNDTVVTKILVGKGAGVCEAKAATAVVLPEGWLKSLIVDGKMTSPKLLDVGGFLPNQNKLQFRPDHLNHNHIEIRDTVDQ